MFLSRCLAASRAAREALKTKPIDLTIEEEEDLVNDAQVDGLWIANEKSL